NAIALSAMLILAFDPTALEDASFQMTFVAVLAVFLAGVPASKWLLDDLKTALREFDDVSRDGRLTPAQADWRVSRRLWCELHGLPHGVITIPWRIAAGVVEALVMSVCVEIIFMYFMVESFHRVALVSPVLNAPAGVLAGFITSLGLLLVFLPSGFS